MKTDQRNRLKAAAMTHIMRIKMHTEDIAHFDPLPAIHWWNRAGKKSRRPLVRDSLDTRLSQAQVTAADVAASIESTSTAATSAAEMKSDSDVESDDSAYAESGSDYSVSDTEMFW